MSSNEPGGAGRPEVDRVSSEKATTSHQTLHELLATYQSWRDRDLLAHGARRASAAGEHEHEHAASVQQLLDAYPPTPSSLEALAAQHELADRLTLSRRDTVCAAREDGASWAQIARSTRTTPEHARAEFVEAIERGRGFSQRYGTGIDLARYTRAAGDWTTELHPGTPAEIIDEIEQAIAREDTDAIEALQQRWWDPTQLPPPPKATPTTDPRLPREDATIVDDEVTRLNEAHSGTDDVPDGSTDAVARVNDVLRGASRPTRDEGRADRRSSDPPTGWGRLGQQATTNPATVSFRPGHDGRGPRR